MPADFDKPDASALVGAGASPAGRHLVIGSDAPLQLREGDRRLLDDLGRIDDRGLEHAEAIMHEHRHALERVGVYDDEPTLQALAALSAVRSLTKRAQR